MRKNRKGVNAAPAMIKYAAENEDWRKICKNCEILKTGNNCFYGCEIIKEALRKVKKKKI